MNIYIDESGIHKQEGHSTTTVVYLEIEQQEKFQRDIELILKNLKLAHFHWSDQGWKVRMKFLKKAINLDFIFKVAIFQNPVNPEKMMEIVFLHLITEKNIRSIFIDGKKTRLYERRLKKILRDKGLSVKKLRSIRNEVAYPGIQLADALAGLARYYFDNPRAVDANKLMKRLKKERKLFGEFIF